MFGTSPCPNEELKYWGELGGLGGIGRLDRMGESGTIEKIGTTPDTKSMSNCKTGSRGG